MHALLDPGRRTAATEYAALSEMIPGARSGRGEHDDERMSRAVERGIESMRPIPVGLVGAGPWAEMVHAPMLAAGSETRLAAVWARRPEAAKSLAAHHGAEAVGTWEALLDRCDAVAFAVPPDVQAQLAVKAARAGKHLLLEKPLALTLADARAVAKAVADAGVMTQLVLSYRFRAHTLDFLAAVRELEPVGAHAEFLTGGYLDGPFATPWRREHGALLDLGPHVLDLLDAALGPIERVTALGDPRRWIALTCRHAGGPISQASLSGTLVVPETIWRCVVHGRQGTRIFDPNHDDRAPDWGAVRRAFADGIRTGRAPEFGVERGLRLQEWIDEASRSL